MDRTELNKKVHLLFDKASSLKPAIELRAKANHDCVLLRAAIQKLQKNLDDSKLPSLPAEKATSVNIQDQLWRIKAELAVWKDMEPEIPQINEDSLKSVEWLEQLKECSKVVSAEKATIKEQIEREVKHLEEVKEMKQILEKTKKKQHTKEKARTEYVEECGHIKSKMSWFIENCLPKSHTEPGKMKSEETLQRKRAVDFIQNLVSKLLDCPDDPYLSITEISEDWYLLLFRAGIVRHHPTNHTLVQLTPFHL